MISTLKKLNKTELAERMKKSFGSCDHVARGNAISKAKKALRLTSKKLQEIIMQV